MQDITTLLPKAVSWAVNADVLTLSDKATNRHVDIRIDPSMDGLSLSDLDARVIKPALAALERRR